MNNEHVKFPNNTVDHKTVEDWIERDVDTMPECYHDARDRAAKEFGLPDDYFLQDETV